MERRKISWNQRGRWAGGQAESGHCMDPGLRRRYKLCFFSSIPSTEFIIIFCSLHPLGAYKVPGGRKMSSFEDISVSRKNPVLGFLLDLECTFAFQLLLDLYVPSHSSYLTSPWLRPKFPTDFRDLSLFNSSEGFSGERGSEYILGFTLSCSGP